MGDWYYHNLALNVQPGDVIRCDETRVPWWTVGKDYPVTEKDATGDPGILWHANPYDIPSTARFSIVSRASDNSRKETMSDWYDHNLALNVQPGDVIRCDETWADWWTVGTEYPVTKKGVLDDDTMTYWITSPEDVPTMARFSIVSRATPSTPEWHPLPGLDDYEVRIENGRPVETRKVPKQLRIPIQLEDGKFFKGAYIVGPEPAPGEPLDLSTLRIVAADK